MAERERRGLDDEKLTLINSLRFESLPNTLGMLSFSSLTINACT